MSWWVYSKNKRELWAIDVEIIAVMSVLGLVAALVVPTLLRNPAAVANAALWLTVAGAGSVAVAKISLFRRGIWVSWGPHLMTAPYARLYKVGYVLFGVGVFLVLLSVRVLSLRGAG